MSIDVLYRSDESRIGPLVVNGRRYPVWSSVAQSWISADRWWREAHPEDNDKPFQYCVMKMRELMNREKREPMKMTEDE